MAEMTDSLSAVATLIPRLRRHARLLSGSQQVGDEYVRICLELISAEPRHIEQGPLPLLLFRTFHQVWAAVATTLERNQPDDEAGMDSRLEQGLAALPSLQRRVLLLQVVEEFSPEEVGQILTLDPALVRALVAEAREELVKEVTVPVLIIEDEPMIAMELSRIVRSMGHTVAGVASRESSALAQAEKRRPGMVLADVQLIDDDNGIVAAQSILERFDVPVVFVTGFPERLLTGGRLEPAFVVAKPFDEEALKVTLAQALRAYASPAQAKAHKTALLSKLSVITGRDVQLMA